MYWLISYYFVSLVCLTPQARSSTIAMLTCRTGYDPIHWVCRLVHGKCIKPYLLGFIAVWHHYQQFVSWMLRQTLMLKGCRVYIPRPWEARSFIHTAHYSAPDRQYVLIRCLDFRFLELWLLGIFNIDNVYYTTLPFRAEIRFLSY